jgi:NAD-dependent deacetylase
MTADAESLFDLIHSARYCTALTGAGVSTLSGIPDFRGGWPQELLQKFSPELLGLYLSGLEELIPAGEEPRFPPFLFSEKIFSLERFEEDPAFFYKALGPIIYSFHHKEPSTVHLVLAELEKHSLLKAVITQNIDMLHQKAGSKQVIELHGSPRFHYCLRCGGIRAPYAEAAAALEAGDMPRCPQCGRILKPAITFYGERLPMKERREAEAELQKTDLLLVLGTSLTVFPAADLPRTVLRREGRIVIVNNQDTALDENAILRLRDLEETFLELGKLLYTSQI